MPAAYKFVPDRVFIDSLQLKCTCGPNAFGRAKPQPVSLSVSLGTSVARAGASDRVDLSVDYSELSKQISKAEERSYASVAELLENIADMSLQKDGIGKVWVTAGLGKGSLRAKRILWELNKESNEASTSSWSCTVEGIEVSVIIGIEENLHERMQKQLVSIDISWKGGAFKSTNEISGLLELAVNEAVRVDPFLYTTNLGRGGVSI
jgi:FolB domain-containing protein